MQDDPDHDLREEEAGAIRIGPTDQGMVRFIIMTRGGVFELDFPPEEAEDIADELRAGRRGRRGRAEGTKPLQGPLTP